MKIRIEYDVFAQFACNAGGVRVATRRTARGASAFSVRFGRLNKVETWYSAKIRSTP